MSNQLVCDGDSSRALEFSFVTQDSLGNVFPSHGTATINDYTSAFVVQVPVPVGLPSKFQIRPKITKAIGAPTQTITVTFNLINTTTGVALAPFSVSVDLVAPTRIALFGAPTIVTGSTIADPGSATISVTLATVSVTV